MSAQMAEGVRGGIEVSVIVPALNGGQFLREQLAAILSQFDSVGQELIVVDNGSTDDTSSFLDALSAREPRLRALTYERPLGVSAARNAGVRAARGQLVLFTDQDDIVGDQWLDAMRASFREGHEFLSARIEQGRLNPGLFNGSEVPAPSPSAGSWLPVAHGSALGASRRALLAAGLWNEAFWFGGDDNDLSWRLQLAGVPFTSVPGAVVHVRWRSRLWPLAKQRFRYGLSRPLLYRSYRVHGMPRNNKLALKRLGYQAISLPKCVRNKQRRREWIAASATMAGSLVGSIRYRVFFVA